MPDGHVAIGRVLAPHGLRGEMKVEPLTDQMAYFTSGRMLSAGQAQYEVESSRRQKGTVILKLHDVESREMVEPLRDSLLSLPESELAPLPEGEYYAYQLIGLEVYSSAAEHLGRLTSLLPTGSNDVYVVEGPRGQLLLPAIDDVIAEVDLAGGRMVVSLMDGILPD